MANLFSTLAVAKQVCRIEKFKKTDSPLILKYHYQRKEGG